MTAATTCLLVALPGEAAPLARRFGLADRGRPGGFPLYAGGHMRLAVTGPGRQAVAGAVRWLQANGTGPTAWINAGIAGHSRLDVGAGMLATCVTDLGTGEQFEPAPVEGLDCAYGRLYTVDEPETGYAREGAYDMEAAGFMAAALPVSAPGLVQCYKIVSDNPAQPQHTVTARQVRELVGEHAERIAELARRLESLAGRAVA